MSDPKSHPISSFSTGMTATCLCTAITVTITDADLFTKPRGHLCHCSNCRKISGSYVSASLAIAASSVNVEDPKNVMKRYSDYATGSGKCLTRCFCGECGSPIMSVTDLYPGMVVLKTGMFPRIPQPECESFAEHRQEWQGRHGDMVQFATVRGGKKLGE